MQIARVAPALLCAMLCMSLSAVAAPAAAPSPIPGLTCSTIFPQTAVPGHPGLRVAIMRVTLAPGLRGPDHSHRTDEYVSIIGGSAKLIVGGRVVKLSNGSAQLVPADTLHQIVNASPTQPLTYLSFKLGSAHRTDDDIVRPAAKPFNHCPRIPTSP
jgi:quercetin dioxygenase-like cupin family protein